MLSTGQLLADRYRLSRRIAVGGMGEVWEAGDTRLDRTVAVKVLKAELSGDPEFLHRFRTEARTTASLNHPNIAGVHDYGETTAPDSHTTAGSGEVHHVAYLVMELVEGDPLAGILAREGRINAERTMDILEQAGNALQAAHERGLVHRDVKPGNILVTGDGKVKLTDFGIAKAADAAPVTRNGMVMGTAHYIAPEQALGHDAEPASDVYSLAVCGWECLTGHRPFLSENAVTVAMMHIRDLPPPLPGDVPPGPRALIEATLVKDPRQRYNTGGEFAAAIAAVRAGHPLPTPSGMVAYSQAPAPTMTMSHPATASQPGPASHPAMHPVATPHGTATPHGIPHNGPPSGVGMIPPQQDRSNNTAIWVVIALVTVVLIVLAAVLLPRLISAGDEKPGPSAPGVGGPAVPGDEDPGANQPKPGVPVPEGLATSPPREPTGHDASASPTHSRQSEPPPTSVSEDNALGAFERSPKNEQLPGMMSTPGTERNGTDQ